MAKDQWDEALRGKKMSEQTGWTIYKYQMPVKEQFTLELPRGARILRVDDQDGMFWLWAMVDIREPDEERHFRAFKCGAPIPDDVDPKNLEYLGFCAIFVQQELALYIFEEKVVNYESLLQEYKGKLITWNNNVATISIQDEHSTILKEFPSISSAKDFIDSGS